MREVKIQHRLKGMKYVLNKKNIVLNVVCDQQPYLASVALSYIVISFNFFKVLLIKKL